MGSRPSFAYRIVSSNYPPFDGGGVHKWGSRWVEPGRFVIHAASQYSLAVLENLVHWNTSRLPQTLVCVVAKIPDSVSQTTSRIQSPESEEQCRRIGNKWYDEAKSAVLWVPSVISPYEQNVLINQLHPDFPGITIDKPHPATLDSRLLGQ